VAPWPGGWWRLRDIVDYELAFGRSLVGTLAREREAFLANSLEAARRSLQLGREEAPRGWVVPLARVDGAPRDRGATRRLVEALLRSAIEVDVALEPFEADGRAHPAGSLVLRCEQPYGRHLKDLFEVQRYPGTKAPYDVAGWTLPLLFGVERVEVSRPFEARTRRAASAEEAVAGFDAKAGWRHDSDALRERAAKELPVVGLYSPWSGDMDEGWMRWFLEHYGIRHEPVRNEHLRGGALARTTLILPGTGASELDRGRSEGSAPSELVGGLDPEGAARIEEFVRRGGHLVAVGGSARWAIDALELGVVDIARGDAAKDFACPGSVLRCVPEVDASGPELLAGLPASVSVFFSRSCAFKLDKEKLEARGQTARVMLRYAPTQLLQSGWIKGGELIEGSAAWVRVRHGEGVVDLFGHAPQYRSWSQQAFALMVRGLLDRSSR